MSLATALQGNQAAPGVGQPERSGPRGPNGQEPGLGGIAGHAMASVFHDTLQADVEETQRMARTLHELRGWSRRLLDNLPQAAHFVARLPPPQAEGASAFGRPGGGHSPG